MCIFILNTHNHAYGKDNTKYIKPLSERKFCLGLFYFAHDLSYQISTLGIPVYNLESDIMFGKSFGISINRYITNNFSIGFQFLQDQGNYEIIDVFTHKKSRKIDQSAFLIDFSYDLLMERVNFKLLKYINPYMSISLGSHMFNIDYYNINNDQDINNTDNTDIDISDIIANSNYDLSHLGFNLTMSFGAKVFLHQGFALYTSLSKISIFSFPRLAIIEYTNLYETIIKFGIEFRI